MGATYGIISPSSKTAPANLPPPPRWDSAIFEKRHRLGPGIFPHAKKKKAWFEIAVPDRATSQIDRSERKIEKSSSEPQALMGGVRKGNVAWPRKWTGDGPFPNSGPSSAPPPRPRSDLTHKPNTENFSLATTINK